MRKIAICMIMALVLSSAVVMVHSEDTSAEPVNESVSGLIADVYRIEVNNISNKNLYISDGSGLVVVYKDGSTSETQIKDAIENGTDPAGITGDYESDSGKAVIYAFHSYKYSYTVNGPYINVDSVKIYLDSNNLFKPMPRTYFASGQLVKVTLISPGSHYNYWSIFGSYDNVNVSGELKHTTTASGYYCISPYSSVTLSDMYVSYTLEYEPLADSNATMGYIALIIGIVAVVPVFAFGMRQRIKDSGIAKRDSIEMEESEVEQKPSKGFFKKKG